jgi:hypothetical protein
MDSYEQVEQRLVNDPNFNLGLTLTHAQFVEGMKSQELEYRTIGEPYKLLSGTDKKIFSIYVIIYIVKNLRDSEPAIC